MNPNILDEIVHTQKQGFARGIVSICSAHPWVLKAAMSRPEKKNRQYAGSGTITTRTGTGTTTSRAGTGTTTHAAGPLLVESTCNQVNQFGGYTGMTPSAFVTYVRSLADENAFPTKQLILGGDHLGPSPWQKEPAVIAMQKSAEMLRDYVQAGFTKLHLDASMRLGDDDPTLPLNLELSARRTAFLARVAEESLSMVSAPSSGLRYVIGSEVPVPGGATTHEDKVSVTKVEDARRTLDVTHAAFLREGLDSAWERVIALVVQPGVEFGDDFVLDYNPTAARFLRRFSETTPFVFEAHSTDYQTGVALSQLVRDHFAILKVGPALTFAFREVVFALAMMENELVPTGELSRLVDIIDEAMQRDPIYWKGHYLGSTREMGFARKYSLSDRIRYYWGVHQVQSALGRLLQNLAGKPLPLTLVSQFMPGQWEKVRSGQIGNTPEALILDKVNSVLEGYTLACG